MAKALDIKEQRKENLREVIDRGDISRDELAKRMGYGSISFISQMRSGYRKITDNNARKLEDVLGKPRYWLDQPHSSTSPSRVVDTDPSLIGGAVQTVAQIQQELSVQISPQKTAEIVELVYTHAQQEGAVDANYARKLVKLAL